MIEVGLKYLRIKNLNLWIKINRYFEFEHKNEHFEIKCRKVLLVSSQQTPFQQINLLIKNNHS